MVPVLAILNLPQWKCPSEQIMKQMTADDKIELWQVRMREISGAIAISAIVQLVIGYTGAVGKLLKIITPLTIVPTVSLVGLTLFQHAGETASKQWGIAVRYNDYYYFIRIVFVSHAINLLNFPINLLRSTTFLLTLFSQVMSDVRFPLLLYRKSSGFEIRFFSVFKLFPVSIFLLFFFFF